MSPKPFNVGDKVKMWNYVDRRTLGGQVWRVTDIQESGTMSQSGWIVSVEIVERGHDTIRIVGYDSDWFLKV